MATVKIKGMSCQHCVKSVKEALEGLPGVANVKVDLEKGKASFDGNLSFEEIKKAVTAIGFEATPNES